jgi:prepilin-type N-terminal cleavage/methylation domain-containing protein
MTEEQTVHTITTPRRTTNAAQGFSLIELTVVIGIIALLVGLLIPALSGAKDAARDTVDRQLINGILTGVQSYQTERSRLPGVYSQDVLCSRQAAAIGLSSMENALLDLIGGVVAPNDAGAEQLSLPTPGRPTPVWINTGKMGIKDGPAYLDIDSSSLRAITGQLARPIVQSIPEIVDTRGAPIIAWFKNELADSTQPLAAEFATDSENRAQFYWGQNYSYTVASALGEERRLDQASLSLLADAGDLNRTTTEGISYKLTSVQAIVGNPSFPRLGNNDVPVPTQPLGQVIIHAPGKDGIYLKRPSQNLFAAGYTPTQLDTLSGRPFQIDDRSMPLGRFDDLFASGN